MWKNSVASLLILCLVWDTSWAAGNKKGPYDVIIKQLFEKVAQEQAPEDIPFVPFEHFHRKKGVYGSYIKQNFHGHTQMAEARRILGVYDNNMFATAWVTSSLLEAYLDGGAPKPSSEQLKMAIDSTLDHHDHNRPYNNSIMTFWEQVYDKNTSYYVCAPYNLQQIFVEADKLPMEQIEQILTQLGLGDLVEAVERILRGKDGYLHVFHIPPDFDDTFVNLGMGSLLYAAKGEFPEAWETWSSQNTNLTSIFDALKKYAYRPFSDDRNVNSIDPRTYMYLRKFLDDAKLQGKNVTVVPTWIQNLDELVDEYEKGVIMPFNINNVDTTVAANTIFGMTNAILTGLVDAQVLDDPEIEALYHNTSALLAYEINTNMTNRPDLALLYYPSQIEYDWFVARSFAVLDEFKMKHGELPRPIMESVYQMLKSAVEGTMTEYIITKGQWDGAGGVFYDDFLGDGDLNKDNTTFKRAEDRIFTTAMAANALLYTWTTHNETSRKVVWRPEAPDVVKYTVKGIMSWLSINALGLNYDPWNAFFSGSFKGPTTEPWDYPGNRYEYINGTAVPSGSHHHSAPTEFCVRGYMEPAEYQAQLKSKHSYIDFHGYNTWDGNFPIWSSEGYTYAISLLVFSRYNDLLAEFV